MNLTEHRFRSLSELVASANGKGFSLTVNTTAGPAMRLAFSLDDLQDVIAYLCQAAAAVHPETRPVGTWAPIEVEGLGLVATADAAETLLVARLAGLDLAFALSSTQVVALGHEFQRTAQTLSASGPAN